MVKKRMERGCEDWMAGRGYHLCEVNTGWQRRECLWILDGKYPVPYRIVKNERQERYKTVKYWRASHTENTMPSHTHPSKEQLAARKKHFTNCCWMLSAFISLIQLPIWHDPHKLQNYLGIILGIIPINQHFADCL